MLECFENMSHFLLRYWYVMFVALEIVLLVNCFLLVNFVAMYSFTSDCFQLSLVNEISMVKD